MKKVLLTLTLISSIALLQSCGGGTAPKMDDAAIAAKVDSLAAPKIEEANAKATTDCEARMSTVVKTKADSIVAAAKATK